MERDNTKPPKKENYLLISGIILIAICCFGPILLATLGALGLSTFTSYFKNIAILAAIVLVAIGWYSYKKLKKIKQ
ncbi:hypothetical protein [Flavobacterium chilense]|uniref:Mercuric ion transport protein n=1 Tax=Flavobacterium chilense TaxID=946677 RepID=A0A1M7MDT2_9FLAO|nr:hypothetical protein [Flavobacterium chilense]SHM88995.1 mercuric ion transport protein [Flavobacterium chilense]